MKKLIWGIITIIQEAINQIIGSSTSQKIVISKFAEGEMMSWGISKSDVEDVFYKGQLSKKKPNTKYKKYANYFIFIKYQDEPKTGNIRITKAWKWDGKS